MSIFREVTKNEAERQKFLQYAERVDTWVGHHILGYDLPVLDNLLGTDLLRSNHIDTLVISKLVNYSRPGGHSVESYGEEFGLPKGKNLFIEFFTKWSQELEDYCVRDVDISHRIYNYYANVINSPKWAPSIKLEQAFQLVTNRLHNNGFAFNISEANKLLSRVDSELAPLNEELATAFPPKEVLIREFTPKLTKFGTISRTSVPRSLHSTIQEYEAGKTYRHTRLVDFNPSSHKQLIEVLTEAGWHPTDKTKTHVETERTLNQAKHTNSNIEGLDLVELSDNMCILKKFGWRINEQNLSTLPATAPAPARLLAQRILLEARRRTLTEWLSLVKCEIRISKENVGIIGIIRKPNSIPNGGKDEELIVERSTTKSLRLSDLKKDAENTSNTLTDLHSKNLLSWLKSKGISVEFVKENAGYLWITIIGQKELEAFYALTAMPISAGMKQDFLKYKVTSERIYGRFNAIGAWTHRMNHQEPNTANIPNEVDIATGNKKLLGKEMRSLWCAPKGRLLVGVDAEAIQLRVFAHLINDKELINAIINGNKSNKTDPHSLNQRVFGSYCKTRNAAKHSLYAVFFGGRAGKISEIMGCSKSQAEEAIDRLIERYPGLAHLEREVFPLDAKRGWFTGLDGRQVRIPGDTVGQRKHLCMSGYLQAGEKVIMALATVKFEPELEKYDALLVNLVHDEWQTEVPNDMAKALQVAALQADSLRRVGEELNLNCPMAGSFYNDDKKDYTIGTKWSVTH